MADSFAVFVQNQAYAMAAHVADTNAGAFDMWANELPDTPIGSAFRRCQNSWQAMNMWMSNRAAGSITKPTADLASCDAALREVGVSPLH